MARMENIHREPGSQAHRLSLRPNIPRINYGGSMGYSNDFKYWINGANYVSRPLTCILMEPPQGFLRLPKAERDYWISALRHLVEVDAHRVEGLTHKITVAIESKPIGGSGQQRDYFTDVTEERPNVSFTWPERPGLAISRFMESWINLFMMSQDTKFALANTIPGMELFDLLPDVYSSTMLFYEPDENNTFITQAWLVGNLFPQDSGDNTAQRDLTSAQQARDLTIPFGGFAQRSLGVDQLAQIIHNGMTQTGADPYKRQAFIQEIQNTVIDKPFGYGASMDSIRAQQVQV